MNVILLDKLTYAGNRDLMVALPVGRLTVVVGDICDVDLVDLFERELTL